MSGPWLHFPLGFSIWFIRPSGHYTGPGLLERLLLLQIPLEKGFHQDAPGKPLGPLSL